MQEGLPRVAGKPGDQPGDDKYSGIKECAQRVLVVRFGASFIHRSQSAVVERLNADEHLPATGAMQQACQRFVHVRAHETTPSDIRFLNEELLRKRLQPAGTSVQQGIRKSDIRRAVSRAQMFDPGSGIVRSPGPEALPEYPFTTEGA